MYMVIKLEPELAKYEAIQIRNVWINEKHTFGRRRVWMFFSSDAAAVAVLWLGRMICSSGFNPT